MSKKALIGKIASKKVREKNKSTFQAYSQYKKTAQLIERAEQASGKRVFFCSSVGSTLNFEVNPYGAYSTTTQKI